MAKLESIGKKLSKLGYDPIVDENMRKYQETWLSWYQGFVDGFHEFTAYDGKDYAQTRKRYTTGMAKVVSELWADYMYNPETEVIIDDDNIQEWWDDKDHDINFSSDMNSFMELVFALGTGATVEYKDENDKSMVDFIRYDMIVPLETVNTDIVSCAFVSQYDNNTVYVNIHERQRDDTYIVYNKYYLIDDEGELGAEVIFDDIQTEFTSEVKLFQIHKPAVANNKSLGSPLGVSIFGNAEDELKAVDIAFDALTKEAEHGKIRIYIKEGALDIGFEDERKTQTFSKGEEFYVLKGDETFDNESLVKADTPQLRAVLMDILETQSNVLGRKCGLGNQAFSTEDGNIYTNTAQVVSTNSRFFATRQKHGTLMKENIIDLVKALYWLEHGKELEHDIEVDMDDSIIHDKEAEEERKERMNQLALSLNLQGKISDIQLYQEIYDLTEEEAIEFEKKQIEQMGLEEEIEFEGEDEL